MTNTNTTIPGATYNHPIPSSWENVKRALVESVRGNGCSAVKIVVLVDECGNPIQHTKPQVTRLEPRGDVSAVCGWLEALGSS